MSLSRRRLIVLSGALGSCGLAVLAHKTLIQAMTAKDAKPSHPTLQGLASHQPSNIVHRSQAAMAPKGLFAPPRGDVRIVVISDLNSQYGSTSYEPEVDQALALIPDWQPDLVLGGGDMVAGQSSSLTPT